MAVPDELKPLKIPSDWGDWNILSGKELILPREWMKSLKKFARTDEDFYPLEVKKKDGRAKVILEGQVPFPVSGEELGKLDGVLWPVPLKIILSFDEKCALIDFERGEPSRRDLVSARNRILSMLADGKISPPGEDDPGDKPWRVVLEESGKFRIERVYLG